MNAATHLRFGNLLGRIGFAGFVFFTVKGLLWLGLPLLAAHWL